MTIAIGLILYFMWPAIVITMLLVTGIGNRIFDDNKVGISELFGGNMIITEAFMVILFLLMLVLWPVCFVAHHLMKVKE